MRNGGYSCTCVAPLVLLSRADLPPVCVSPRVCRRLSQDYVAERYRSSAESFPICVGVAQDGRFDLGRWKGPRRGRFWVRLLCGSDGDGAAWLTLSFTSAGQPLAGLVGGRPLMSGGPQIE
jgi:hypothetical protein